MSDNLVMKKPGELSVVTWIKRRIKRNKNNIGLFIGATGSGKSYACISEAQQIDPEFDIKKQVVFKLSSVMKLLNDDAFKKKKWKIVIYEEFQISASNRAWQSTMNKMINYLFSTFRHQNIILFINCPYRDFIDSQTLKLIHSIQAMQGIDRKKKVAKVSVKIMQYNDRMKKFYEHSLYFIDSDKKVKQVGLIQIKKPDDASCKIYEEMKTEFTNKLNKDILASCLEVEEGKQKKGKPLKQLTELQEKIVELHESGTTSQKEIGKLLGKDPSQVCRNIQFIRNKGYLLRKEGYSANGTK